MEGRKSLYFTNTLRRKKELFRSKEESLVKMFTCGPSIYRRPHIGNYRTFLFEDILQRYLEYLGYKVHRVLNFTDVEDKAIAEARQRGATLGELTDPVTAEFFQEADLLRIKLPEYIPRSSTSVQQAVHLIQLLLEKGYAYWHGKDIFFDPLEFKGFGKLYGLDMSRWPKKKIRFRKDTYPGQRWNLGDFILWHGHRQGEEDSFFWETEIGKGRPAWNIQDPAMITQHLGYQVDISCGGVDNLYRHHDYNIAVIEAISEKEFSRYWLHGEHVLVDGTKMSKSKGNIVYPKDLLRKGYSGRDIRFFLIYGHYRRKMNLTQESLEGARRKLASFEKMVEKFTGTASGSGRSQRKAEPLLRGLTRDFEEHMNNDLDVQGAFDAVFENLTRLAEFKESGGLGSQDCERVADLLPRIDMVLKVLS